MTKSIVDIVAEEIQERKMRAAGMERGSDGNWYPIGVRPKHSITREDARDPCKPNARASRFERSTLSTTCPITIGAF